MGSEGTTPGSLHQSPIAFLLSHLRREFYDLDKVEAPIATETLSRIAALYQIEAGIQCFDPCSHHT